MTGVEITLQQIGLAREKSKEMGKLRNSITGGQGNMAGFIGEIVVADLIGAEMCNTYDYDLIKDGIKIDVKTKRTNYEPQPHYDCSVAALNTKQKCDAYCFVRVTNDLTTAWVLGFYDKHKYFDDAKFYMKGDVDGKFTFKSDCYNLPISSLKSFLDLEKEINITRGS